MFFLGSAAVAQGREGMMAGRGLWLKDLVEAIHHVAISPGQLPFDQDAATGSERVLIKIVQHEAKAAGVPCAMVRENWSDLCHAVFSVCDTALQDSSRLEPAQPTNYICAIARLVTQRWWKEVQNESAQERLDRQVRLAAATS